MGNYNTIYGNVSISPNAEIGDGNTIVGPTDERGNIIIRAGTTVGYGAHGDPTSVVIGAGAGGTRRKTADSNLSPK